MASVATTLEPNAAACGIRWFIRPLRIDEQFEVECILLKFGASPLAMAVAALVHGLAPTLAELLRDTVGTGPAAPSPAGDEPAPEGPKPFDLANIITLDTADPRLRDPWEKLLDGLGQTAGDIVRDAVPALAEQLDHRMLQRLFDLAVIGKTFAFASDGMPIAVTGYEALAPVLRRPGAKYELLGAALMVTYGSPVEDEGEDEEPAGGGDG